VINPIPKYKCFW